MGTEIVARPVGRTALEPQSLDEARLLAKIAVDSRFFAVKSAEEALVIMLTGRELGLTAMQSLRGIYIVQGRPLVAADTLVAAVLASGKCEEWQPLENTADRCTIRTKRRGAPAPVTKTWTMADARTAGLVGKGIWSQYPKTMLRHRCAAELVREVYPDVALGMYVPEEIDPHAAPAPDADDHGEAPAALQAVRDDAACLGEALTAEQALAIWRDRLPALRAADGGDAPDGLAARAHDELAARVVKGQVVRFRDGVRDDAAREAEAKRAAAMAEVRAQIAPPSAGAVLAAMARDEEAAKRPPSAPFVAAETPAPAQPAPADPLAALVADLLRCEVPAHVVRVWRDHAAAVKALPKAEQKAAWKRAVECVTALGIEHHRADRWLKDTLKATDPEPPPDGTSGPKRGAAANDTDARGTGGEATAGEGGAVAWTPARWRMHLAAKENVHAVTNSHAKHCGAFGAHAAACRTITAERLMGLGYGPQEADGLVYSAERRAAAKAQRAQAAASVARKVAA